MAKKAKAEKKQEPESNQIVKKPDPVEIRDLLNKDGHVDIVTEGNIRYKITLNSLNKLVRVPSNKPGPTDTDLTTFAFLILEYNLNPHFQECWLIYMNDAQGYSPVLAEKARMKMVDKQPTYEGMEQGWITKDGTRHPCDESNQAVRNEICGVWGKFYRTDRKPVYLETFTDEYSRGGIAWEKMQTTMILKVNRDHGHRLLYPNLLGGIMTENEAAFANRRKITSHDVTTPRRKDRQQELPEINTNGDVINNETQPAAENILSLPVLLEQWRKICIKDNPEITADEVLDSFVNLLIENTENEEKENYITWEGDLNADQFTPEKLEIINNAIKEKVDGLD